MYDPGGLKPLGEDINKGLDAGLEASSTKNGFRGRKLGNMTLRGCGTALVTPFRQDGSIDEPSLRNLVAWQVESGIDFLVPCGTTGETPTLSRDEQLQVVDVTVEVAGGRVPILAGATANATPDAVERAKEMAARPGVDGILTASPYYNK